MVEKEGFFMLQTAYYEVANRLERIDFPSIWPGFSSGSFALYQEKLACVSGQLVPRPPEFRGNTAILWQGSPLAIWNLVKKGINAAGKSGLGFFFDGRGKCISISNLLALLMAMSAF